MAVSAIGAIGSSGVGGVDLNQLWQQYQAQIGSAGTAGADPAAAAAANAGLSGLSGLSGITGITGVTDAGAATRGSDFASMIGQGLQKVDSLDQAQSTKAIQAATGDLTDVHDYVIAAQEASTAVALTTTVRDKALDAFNEIMRMPL